MKKNIFLIILAFYSLTSDGKNLDFSSTHVRTRSIHDSVKNSIIVPIAMNKVISSESMQLENERYDQLPICPEHPICPDEHGQWPVDAHLSDCPPICTKTRQLFGKKPNGSYTKSIDALCPANYLQIASFNVQDEVAYTDDPDIISPIAIDKWSWYIDNDYTCTPKSIVHVDTLCGMARRHPIEKRNIDQQGANLGINPEYPANINGYAGTWLNETITDRRPWRSKECYTAGCLIKTPDCGDRLGDEVLSRMFYFPYQLYQCQPPAGVYATGKKVPISAVCAHRQVKWQPSTSSFVTPS